MVEPRYNHSHPRIHLSVVGLPGVTKHGRRHARGFHSSEDLNLFGKDPPATNAKGDGSFRPTRLGSILRKIDFGKDHIKYQRFIQNLIWLKSYVEKNLLSSTG